MKHIVTFSFLVITLSASAFAERGIGGTCTQGIAPGQPTSCRAGLSCERADTLVGGSGLCMDTNAPRGTYGGFCSTGTRLPCTDGSTCRSLPALRPVLGGPGVCVAPKTEVEDDDDRTAED